ncbi:hypothetical protein RI129_006612 [Pyrocoelia pectoralis]|uniref:Carboxylesterase type B domain-containing protein n=1 Tax=Pyrocoelia pectoralis TaxID=417401 RepID=A0AAN7VCS4_9COLE
MDNELIVNVKQGKLKGKVCIDFDGRPFYSFQGIPYALPPVGNLRFKAPKPPKQWSGIRDATIEGESSYSRHHFFFNIVGSEDCLFLNVYTPSLIGPLKPVMFWIHGGGYLIGSGNSDCYGPEYLITEDVVIVTINYRLGILGFLSLNDPSLEVPGNAGLKDQVMALRWVKENIDQFGGDPDNVTIFGESVGGGSVHFLMLSPMGKGLFHKAIIQSGSAIGNRGRGQYSTPSIANVLNLQTVSDAKILNILMDMPVEELFELQEKVPDRYQVRYFRPFGAVVEQYVNPDTFLAKEPLDIIKSGEYNHVPLMIGFTSREGYFAKQKYNISQIGGDFEDEILFSLNVNKDTDLSKEVARKIKNFFYGDEEPSSRNTTPFYLLQSDNMFLRPLYNSVKHHCSTSKYPVYFYRISIDSNLNFFKKHFRINEHGVSHADDIGYLFTHLFSPKIVPGSIEEDGMKVFVKLWTTFAKTGNPNPTTPHPLINVTWKPAKKNELNFLDIGENVTVGVNPESTRMRFWDEIEEMCLNR